MNCLCQQFIQSNRKCFLKYLQSLKATNSIIFNQYSVCLRVCRAVRDLRWLAEATYTGEALEFALTATLKDMRKDNKVVLVLTDGRSDSSRDRVPLNVLCGKGLVVSAVYRHRGVICFK